MHTHKYRKRLPFRIIFTALLTLTTIFLILIITLKLVLTIKQVFLLVLLTQICVVVNVIGTDENPDYKVSWIFFIMSVPIVGVMAYAFLYSRALKVKYVKRYKRLNSAIQLNNAETVRSSIETSLENENKHIYGQALMLKESANTAVYNEYKTRYYSSGEQLCDALTKSLRKAKKYILMEYFLISDGILWGEISKILKEKAQNGVLIYLIFDDVGSMRALNKKNLYELRKYGVKILPFAPVRVSIDGALNNRNHRKITVVDGTVAFTGGVNLADEYVNIREKFGHWKDSGIKIEGEAVKEYVKLFELDYGISQPRRINTLLKTPNKKTTEIQGGYLIPFGDGPKPIYKDHIAKTLIENMLSVATEYVIITTPYLIVDNEILSYIENTSQRGVNVKIILPHIPDKKLVYKVSRSYYARLIEKGVEIFEYKPGFIHAKTYLVDGKLALLGTINLDYRSLAHHFENGVWLYNCKCINEIKKDLNQTLNKCIQIKKVDKKVSTFNKATSCVLRIIAPLL